MAGDGDADPDRLGDHLGHAGDSAEQGGQGGTAAQRHPRAEFGQGGGEPGEHDLVAGALLDPHQDRPAGQRLAAPFREAGRDQRD
jgi:hypothetical protein